jgi:hypothetical protein
MAFNSAVALTPISPAALTATSVAAAAMTAADGTNGNKFVANANTILRVKNASGAQITVTLHTNRTVDGLTVPDKTFTVAATTGDVIFTGITPTFWQNSSQEVWIEFSAVTTVTVMVIQP